MTTYFDASALVKLLVMESGRDVVRGAWSLAADRFTSIITYAELRASVAAAGRAGRIQPAAFAAVHGRIEDVWQEVVAVAIDETLVRHAGDLAGRHRIRANDAIHVASAHVIGDRSLTFVAFDERLRAAARAEGFAVLPAG